MIHSRWTVRRVVPACLAATAWSLSALAQQVPPATPSGRAAQPAGAAATAPPAVPPASATNGLAATPDYVLGPGDVLRINVYQNPELSLDTRISEAGAISYPLLGTLQLGGMTVGQAEALIARGLLQGKYVNQPQVSVFLQQVRGNQASVLGQVNKPGRFPLEQASLRMTDLVAMAGGVTVGGADAMVLVGRRNGQPYRVEIDLPSVFRPNAVGDNPVVQNGDVLFVERSPQVYIYGEVQRPGPMRLERAMTVMQGLATGGGLTLRGTERAMRIHRRAADGRVQIIQPALDDPLRDGDVIYVRESLF